MSDQTTHKTEAQNELDLLRPHKFDGIQEFDKPMPNWWLGILFTSIAFALVYWASMHAYGPDEEPGRVLTKEMQQAADEAAKKSGLLSNELLWKMSRDEAVLSGGRATFVATCAQCHLPDLSGAIGPNLKDEIWIHGGEPMGLVKVITEGVLAKGMPPWGPVLGRQKIAEVLAYILSYHKEPAPGMPYPPPTPSASVGAAPAPAPATPEPAK